MTGIIKAICLMVVCEVIATAVVLEEYSNDLPHTALYWVTLWLGLVCVLLLSGLVIWYLWELPANTGD